MRVTNNMITGNTKSNINSNKVFVDKYNTQMTTQKKISRPSDDPVIAIRSLLTYIRKHDFKIFGYYRIVLGIIVAAFCFMGVIA